MVRGRVATLAQPATGSVVDLAAANRNTAAGAARFGACAPATLLTERRSRHARAASASWSTPLCATSSGWSEAAISRGFMRSGQCGDSRRLLCCDDAPHRRCRRVRHRHPRRRTRRARLLRRLGTDPAQRPQDRWRRVDEPQADVADRPDGQPVGPADSQVGWPASSSWCSRWAEQLDAHRRQRDRPRRAPWNDTVYAAAFTATADGDGGSRRVRGARRRDDCALGPAGAYQGLPRPGLVAPLLTTLARHDPAAFIDIHAGKQRPFRRPPVVQPGPAAT
jgi:hypothetical protein